MNQNELIDDKLYETYFNKLKNINKNNKNNENNTDNNEISSHKLNILNFFELDHIKIDLIDDSAVVDSSKFEEEITNNIENISSNFTNILNKSLFLSNINNTGLEEVKLKYPLNNNSCKYQNFNPLIPLKVKSLKIVCPFINNNEFIEIVDFKYYTNNKNYKESDSLTYINLFYSKNNNQLDFELQLNNNLNAYNNIYYNLLKPNSCNFKSSDNLLYKIFNTKFINKHRSFEEPNINLIKNDIVKQTRNSVDIDIDKNSPEINNISKDNSKEYHIYKIKTNIKNINEVKKLSNNKILMYLNSPPEFVSNFLFFRNKNKDEEKSLFLFKNFISEIENLIYNKFIMLIEFENSFSSDNDNIDKNNTQESFYYNTFINILESLNYDNINDINIINNKKDKVFNNNIITTIFKSNSMFNNFNILNKDNITYYYYSNNSLYYNNDTNNILMFSLVSLSKSLNIMEEVIRKCNNLNNLNFDYRKLHFIFLTIISENILTYFEAIYYINSIIECNSFKQTDITEYYDSLVYLTLNYNNYKCINYCENTTTNLNIFLEFLESILTLKLYKNQLNVLYNINNKSKISNIITINTSPTLSLYNSIKYKGFPNKISLNNNYDYIELKLLDDNNNYNKIKLTSSLISEYFKFALSKKFILNNNSNKQYSFLYYYNNCHINLSRNYKVVLVTNEVLKKIQDKYLTLKNNINSHIEFSVDKCLEFNHYIFLESFLKPCYFTKKVPFSNVLYISELYSNNDSNNKLCTNSGRITYSLLKKISKILYLDNVPSIIKASFNNYINSFIVVYKDSDKFTLDNQANIYETTTKISKELNYSLNINNHLIHKFKDNNIKNRNDKNDLPNYVACRYNNTLKILNEYNNTIDFNVITYSKYLPSCLNLLSIIYLNKLGIKKEVFYDIITKYFDNLLDIYNNLYMIDNDFIKLTIYNIKNLCSNNEEFINIIENNIFLNNVLNNSKLILALNIFENMNIIVEESIEVYCMIDEYNVLKEDEYYLKINNKYNNDINCVLNGYYPVINKPCVSVNDILILKFVDIKLANTNNNNYNTLDNYENVLVYSAHCKNNVNNNNKLINKELKYSHIFRNNTKTFSVFFGKHFNFNLNNINNNNNNNINKYNNYLYKPIILDDCYFKDLNFNSINLIINYYIDYIKSNNIHLLKSGILSCLDINNTKNIGNLIEKYKTVYNALYENKCICNLTDEEYNLSSLKKYYFKKCKSINDLKNIIKDTIYTKNNNNNNNNNSLNICEDLYNLILKKLSECKIFNTEFLDLDLRNINLTECSEHNTLIIDKFNLDIDNHNLITNNEYIFESLFLYINYCELLNELDSIDLLDNEYDYYTNIIKPNLLKYYSCNVKTEFNQNKLNSILNNYVFNVIKENYINYLKELQLDISNININKLLSSSYFIGNFFLSYINKFKDSLDLIFQNYLQYINKIIITKKDLSKDVLDKKIINIKQIINKYLINESSFKFVKFNYTSFFWIMFNIFKSK